MHRLRPVLALVLAAALSADLLPRSQGAVDLALGLLFPYLWLYLLLDYLVSRRAFGDLEVFLAGTAFSFLYGAYTKDMHDAFGPLGLDWAALVSAPLEWGMFSVLWMHLLEGILPRNPTPRGTAIRWSAIGILTAWAVSVYCWKTMSGAYAMSKLLGPSTAADLCLAMTALWTAVFLRRRAGLLASQSERPVWLWLLMGANLWLLGAAVFSRAAEGFGLARAVSWGAQGALALALAGAATLGRGWSELDEPPDGPAPALIAAGVLRAAWLLAGWRLAAAGRPEAGLLAGLLCDIPAKLLFCWAFLTERQEV